MKRLISLLPERESKKLDGYIVSNFPTDAFLLAEELRNEGLNVEFDLSNKKFTKQLDDVLKHVDAMNEVDTSNVEPMAHAIDFVNVMREDKVFYEQTKEELMKNAPYEEDGFFRVPKIN